MSTAYQYEWNPAKSLLNLRDRFTRVEIQREFEADPELHKLDVEGGFFATPVAGNRYTVIWKRLGNLAEVKAVVASQLRGEDPAALRTKLERVVEAESFGQLTLE
jgi:hypothetical protein